MLLPVVITHEHPDHFDVSNLQTIVNTNPTVIIYAPRAVTVSIPNLPTRTVKADDEIMAQGFSLLFTGGTHATIHEDFHPQFENIGVVIDDIVYHPGDSFSLPGRAVKVLSVPIIAPWAKVSESMDFMVKVKA